MSQSVVSSLLSKRLDSDNRADSSLKRLDAAIHAISSLDSSDKDIMVAVRALKETSSLIHSRMYEI